MQFLAILIAMFSVANTEILSTDSYESDLDNLFLPNPPFSGLLSLNPTTPANEPSEPSLPNADLETTLDMPESLTFNPQITQQPGAKSADELSMIDTSIVNTMAQTSTDDSYNLCSPDTSTGRKQKKRQECVNLLHFLLRPKSPGRVSPKGTRTREDQRKDQLTIFDERYMNDKYGVDESKRAERVQRAVALGQKWCNDEHGRIDADATAYEIPLCCLGPEETVSFTVPSRLFRRAEISFMNVFNCILFILERPLCVRPLATWYCCNQIASGIMTEWGFKGLNCLSLESPIPIN